MHLPSTPPAADYEKALAADASLWDWRRGHKPPGSTPGGRSVGSLGSLHGSPAGSAASPPPQPRPAVGSPGSGVAAAAPRLRGRKSSQAEGTPAMSHFSIAAVLKGTTAAAAAGKPSPQQQQQQEQQQQQQQVRIQADATLAAQQQEAQERRQQRERSGGEASTSGRPTSGGSWGLPAVRSRLGSVSLQDGGSGCVPLEGPAASPLRGGIGGACAAVEHASPAPAPRGQQQQQEEEQGQGQAQGAQLTADDHHARGYALRKRGDFAGAVREYGAALTLDPAHFRARFNRAFSLDKVQPWLCGPLI